MTLSASSALCGIFTLYFAGSPLVFSPAPRGSCPNCCPLREARDVKFLLYTRNNPIKPDNLFVSDVKGLKNSNFNISEQLILYIHGFSEHAPGGEGQSGQEIRDAFLKAGNYNIILVDWSPLTALPWYTNTVQNMPHASRYIARFLRFLIDIGFPLERIHVIGFSLGAEAAGFAGQQLQEWGIKLQRITGLDPAFPLFDEKSTHRRLGPSDAQFVDIIHTDGGLFGNPHPLGHADFYPNGGIPLQPGCAKQEIANNRWLGIIIGCSHQRAWQYFIESMIWPKAFRADRCEESENFKGIQSCQQEIKAYMGIAADPRLRGKFYLDTYEEAPFGKN